MEASVDTHPYHHYLFFHLRSSFYALSSAQQSQVKRSFKAALAELSDLLVTSYVTLGFKPDTTFMLWLRATDPAAVTSQLPKLFHSELGPFLKLTHAYFGIVRPSQYSGRTGKPEQVIQNYDQRLPYLTLYPFTKTPDWYLLSADNRRSIMGQHIKTGLTHPDIRQCLLYSYGLDNQEFLVSYETPTLEEFQDLVIEMRGLVGRPYTQSDTPIYTCLHKPLDELVAWL